jgi:hypothetical protein
MPSSKNNRGDRSSRDANRGKPENLNDQRSERSRGGKQDISSSRDANKSGRTSQESGRGSRSEDSSYGNHLDEE